MLTQAELEEIEKRSKSSNTHERTTCMLMRFSELLATVKELQMRDKEQRELLEECLIIIRDAYPPWPILVKQIEQALK